MRIICLIVGHRWQTEPLRRDLAWILGIDVPKIRCRRCKEVRK